MSLIADINSALSDIASVFADDAVIEYRTLTSNPNAESRTYSNWASLSGARTVDYEQNQVRDENDSAIWWQEFTCQLRMPDNLGIALSVYDQIRIGGSPGQIWSVNRAPRSGAGSVQEYILGYRLPMMQDPRSGGV